MTILGALNAVLRYSSKFTGQVWSSNAFLEGQWYLFSAVFLLGAGYTLYKDKHVRVDVMYSRLSKTGQRRINLIGTLIFAIPFCILGIWSSLEFVFNSWSIWEQSPDAGGLPRYRKDIDSCWFHIALVSMSGLAERLLTEKWSEDIENNNRCSND